MAPASSTSTMKTSSGTFSRWLASPWARRPLEAEAGVVAGVPVHDDERASPFAKGRDAALEQGRADPLALELRQDGQRRHHHPGGPGLDGHRAEEDVPDDALAVHGHERDQVRARLPEAVDDPRLDRAPEGGRMQVPDRRGVVGAAPRVSRSGSSSR